MNKEQQLTKEWIDALFNSGEYTCMGSRYENKTFPVSKIAESQEYVSINPMKKGTTRKGINVTRFSNFLFEMDTHSQREQHELILRSKLPWSTMTTSASKSLHFIVALEEDLGERSLYSAYFKAIRDGLLKYGADIDVACKDPGRFTRGPWGVNTKDQLVEKKPNVHDRIQKVAQVKGRVSVKQIDAWLEKHEIDVMSYVETPTTRTDYVGTFSNADTKLKIEWILKYYMAKQPSYDEGNYNYQFTMACQLLRAGLSEDEVRQYFMSEMNHIHQNDPIKGAVQTIKADEHIYVPTMDERREFYRQQDEDEIHHVRRQSYKREGIDIENIEARPEDVSRYEIVGTEYFKIDSVTDVLIPWTKAIFEKFYGSRAIPSASYDKFGYKPDYISEQFPRNLGIDGKTRNIFTRPSWKPSPGKWETIEGGLRHGFGEHYDLILQYCAILIAYPEAKLPNLWFIGPENKGKSAVVAIFKYLVGLKATRKISCKGLESDFTDFLGASQLVVVEEAGNWKSPQETMSNVKDWTTEFDTQEVNPKYGKKYDSPIHSKFMFTSNDWDSAPVSGSASRIWFVEVNKEPKNKVTNYYHTIQKEMGHFVDYLIKSIVPTLKTRQNERGGTVLDTTHRLYFDPSEYETELKQFVKSLNKSSAYETLMETACSFFESFPEEDIYWFDLKAIKRACDWKYRTDPNNKEIKLLMKQEFDQELTRSLDRPDSIRWMEDRSCFGSKRKSHWFSITRQQAIGDSLFDLEAVNIG